MIPNLKTSVFIDEKSIRSCRRKVQRSRGRRLRHDIALSNDGSDCSNFSRQPICSVKVFSGDRTIGFVDPRRFGTIDIVPKLDVSDWFENKNLGQEIWPVHHTGKWWKSQMHNIRSPLKVALLRQDRIVGIGNILASELCFAAELSPFIPVNTITELEWTRLADGAYQRIEAVLQEERGEKIGFLHEGAKNPQAFQIYGRQGESCPKCQSAIVKCTQANRATYFCHLSGFA